MQNHRDVGGLDRQIQAMTDTKVVLLEDGTQAELKRVQVSTWQTVLVAIELPKDAPPQPTPTSNRISLG